MGRPLNKKYFGNWNTGLPSTLADNNIGGKGVASAAVTVAGSYTTKPTFTFSVADLVNGVRATGNIMSEVLSATIGGTQTAAYAVGTANIRFVSGSNTVTFTPTINTAELTSFAYASATTVQFHTTTVPLLPGTSVAVSGDTITGTMTIGGSALLAGRVYYVGGTITATSASLYDTYAHAIAGGETGRLAIVDGTTAGATFTYGTTYGKVTAVTPVARGTFDALTSGAQSALATVGSGLTITPTYRAKSVVITQTGSGYLSAPTVTYTNQGGVTIGNITLVAVNLLPAIVTYAKTTSNGSSLAGDIVKQVSGRRYKIATRDGTGICKLKTSGAVSAVGEMTIKATDRSGKTYYVAKLTENKAVVVPYGASGHEFPLNSDGTAKSVMWTFGNAVSNTSVTIENS